MLITWLRRGCSSLWHVLFMICMVRLANCYKPVILMHGILDKASDLSDLANFITKAHPGTKVHSIDLFDELSSLTPLQKQLKTISNVTKQIMHTSPEGVHLIGFSQGGLLSRGLVQTLDDHNIGTFIALSSPLNGQYGDTSYINELFPGQLKEDMYKIFYTSLGQRFSVANYWKDPHHINYYEEYSAFLGPLNNESTSNLFPHPSSWRKNFAKLENLVLIGGPDDGVITPWMSSHFACYDSNEKVVTMRNLKVADKFGPYLELRSTVVLKLKTFDEIALLSTREIKCHDLSDQNINSGPTVDVIDSNINIDMILNQEAVESVDIYQDDVFGLKTLDKAGKIHECVVPGVEHVHWHRNETVFMKCIEPWLN